MSAESVHRPKIAILRSSRKLGPLSQFAVVMVEPEFGINLGYLARAAANFGMKRLVVVSSDRLDSEKLSQALLYAAHGRYLVENLKYLPSVSSLKGEFKTLIGTTAIEATRKSNLTRRTLAPEQCAEMIYNHTRPSSRTRIKNCIVFGRDTTGLTNDELRVCDYVITIRTLSGYNTLNVSHAAAIMFYLFAKTWASIEKAGSGPATVEFSSRGEKERVVSLFLKLAHDSEFQPFKKDLLQQSLERVLNRSDPTSRELYLLMGLASKADSKIMRLSGGISRGKSGGE